MNGLIVNEDTKEKKFSKDVFEVDRILKNYCKELNFDQNKLTTEQLNSKIYIITELIKYFEKDQTRVPDCLFKKRNRIISILRKRDSKIVS